MYEIGVVYRNIQRADEDVAGKLAAFGTATVHEAMGRVGLMTPNMRPIYAGAQASGTAVTVLLQPGDNWMLHVAAEQIRPGDVVVAAVTAATTMSPGRICSTATCSIQLSPGCKRTVTVVPDTCPPA